MHGFDPMSDVNFKGYADKLLAVKDCVMSTSTSKDTQIYTFSTHYPNALKVSLIYNHTINGGSFHSLEVEGVDAGYWHTDDIANLDFHIELAVAALKGDVAYNRSTILGRKEVCFKVQDGWQCAPTDQITGFHDYIKHRKNLRREIK